MPGGSADEMTELFATIMARPTSTMPRKTRNSSGQAMANSTAAAPFRRPLSRPLVRVTMSLRAPGNADAARPDADQGPAGPVTHAMNA